MRAANGASSSRRKHTVFLGYVVVSFVSVLFIVFIGVLVVLRHHRHCRPLLCL